jgi:hypothetical protein
VAWDALRRVAVIYGGYSANVGGTVTELNDTWEWDGLQWAQRFPAHNPGFRRFQKLAFDTNRNVVLLFGGYSPAGPVYPNNEVWGYDGNDWTLLSADTPSGPAQSVLVQSAVFDSARAKMIVITSPAPYSPYLNATWEFDSAALTWSLASTGTPIKWSGSAFAYDSVRHLTVGQTHGQVGSYVASTWTFNGASWTDLGIVTADRKDTCMAFDTTRRRAVIYSGGRLDGPSFYTTDTWAFDGAAWQQILPNMPLLPYDLVMPLDVVCDTARRAMVMVGQSQNGSFGDVPMQTWEYRYLDQVVFDRQPESQPLVPDGNATFEVVAAGYGLLSYQWWRDDQMLIDGPAPGGGAIAGAQTSALSLTGVQAADGGVYACEVSNGCGTAVSDDALLGTPAAVASWASVMTHGTLGELAIPLVEGADTVECRLAGAQHLIRVELTSTGGAPTVTGMVQAVDQNTAATFDAAAGLTDNGGGSYTLDLVFNPPLPTALDSPNVYGCYRIDLASNISGLTGDTDMRFNVVVGDVSADGKTLLNDFALTKLRAQVVPFAVDPGNLADIRKDISNDGQIVLNDVALTKLNQGNGRILTCP